MDPKPLRESKRMKNLEQPLVWAESMCLVCRVRTPTAGDPHSPTFLPPSWEAENKAIAGVVHAILQNDTEERHPGSAGGQKARSLA